MRGHIVQALREAVDPQFTIRLKPFVQASEWPDAVGPYAELFFEAVPRKRRWGCSFFSGMVVALR